MTSATNPYVRPPARTVHLDEALGALRALHGREVRIVGFIAEGGGLLAGLYGRLDASDEHVEGDGFHYFEVKEDDDSPAGYVGFFRDRVQECSVRGSEEVVVLTDPVKWYVSLFEC